MYSNRQRSYARPLPMSTRQGPSRDGQSATQQLRAAREFAMRCMRAPELRREEERQAQVTARSEHRRNAGYDIIEAKFQKLMRAYSDSAYFPESARDCFVAAVSSLQPRRNRRKALAVGENQVRRQWREEIIEHARQLDAIDKEGGFDSADDFSLPSLGPPEGDTHVNRAWKAILEVDQRRLAHIVRLRRQRVSHWLSRAIVRYALGGLWGLIVVVVALELDDKVLQVAVLFPVLALPAWMRRRARAKDRFIEKVLDIQQEHRLACGVLSKHLGRPLRVDPPTRDFARDPRECPLTELLGGTLSR